jgi:transcriptional regulator with XRE-family HTH domain
MAYGRILGAWLQRRRRALGLTQADLGRRVGIAGATIRKIEADQRRPSTQVAERLADALAVAPAGRAPFVRAARGELSDLAAIEQDDPAGRGSAHVQAKASCGLSVKIILISFTMGRIACCSRRYRQPIHH